MKYTENYNLYKPDYDDTIDVNYLNQNMDVLDNTVHGLNYIQNVNTSDKGMTFIKRDGQQIEVPLNYLKLTGGTVTGNVEVTGKLTNNSKDIGRLFKNANPILTPLIDWDAIANYKGTTTKVQKQTIHNGNNITLDIYSFCVYVEYAGIFAYENGDIYLKDSFKNYDKLLVVTLAGNATPQVNYTILDCGELDWAMNNLPNVSLTGNAPYSVGRWAICPYKNWGTVTKVSTDTIFRMYSESCDMVEIYGIKYTEVK